MYPDRTFGQFGRIQIDYQGHRDGRAAFLVLLDANRSGQGGRVIHRATSYLEAERAAIQLAAHYDPHTGPPLRLRNPAAGSGKRRD